MPNVVYSATAIYKWTCPQGVTSVTTVCNGASTFNALGSGVRTVVPGTSYAVVIAASATVTITWSWTTYPATFIITDTVQTTFVPPSDFNSTCNSIELIGPGGGGQSLAAGGGGGGGQYARQVNATLTAHTAYTINIPAGGTAGAASATNTTFAGAATYTANKGAAGAAGSGGAGGSGTTNATSSAVGGTGGATASATPGGGGGAEDAAAARAG